MSFTLKIEPVSHTKTKGPNPKTGARHIFKINALLLPELVNRVQNNCGSAKYTSNVG
jgi:hypothetical protein